MPSAARGAHEDLRRRTRVVLAREVPPVALHEFLASSLGLRRAEFLRAHADWMHRGADNRICLALDGRIVGYVGAIPGRCWIGGDLQPMRWGVDVVIHPELRGRGLFEMLVDWLTDGRRTLVLVFPNRLSTSALGRIARGDEFTARAMDRLQLPLIPTAFLRRDGRRWPEAAALGLLAHACRPLAWGLRRRLASYQPRARRLDAMDPDALADVFLRHRPAGLVCVARDADFFRWRHCEGPDAGATAAYVSGPPGRPTHYLIARPVAAPDGGAILRILDLFGDVGDEAAVRDLVRCAVRDAVHQRMTAVELLGSPPALGRYLRSTGFVIRSPKRVMALSPTAGTTRAFARSPIHFVLGDSDNDAPA